MEGNLSFKELALYAIDTLLKIDTLDTFCGVDCSQEESLLEYGFIHSEVMGLALYQNEYGMLGATYISAGYLRADFIDRIESMGESSIKGFLDFCSIKSINEYKECPISNLVNDFCGYFGIENSPLATSSWHRGFNTKEDIKHLLLY